MKVGKYRIIPKGIKVWSIELQNNVTFDEDIVVKITNTVYNSDNWVYGIICEEIFKFMIPGMLEYENRNLGFNYSDTKKFIKSKGMFNALVM